MSTCAQSLFGLDLGSGMTRYHLLLPLDPAPGMTFGLAALALGHHSSVLLNLPQQRWRFTGGRLLPVGALQAVGGMALGFLEHQRGLAVLVAAAVACLVSLHYYGRRWERRAAAGVAC